MDEHTPKYWVSAVRRADATIRITRVGLDGAPSHGTLDPGLLRFCEASELVLITCDRRTMYEHIADHTAAGNVFCGMLVVEGPVTTEELVSDLVLIHTADDAADFIDTVMTLPL